MGMTDQDEAWMRLAYKQAEKAGQEGEVPVGAVLVHQEALIAQTHNGPIQNCDPSAHAEVLAIRAGGQYFQNYRLVDTTLYVTLEPCIMCAGLMVHARVKRLVFGAFDPKAGGVSSIAQVLDHPKLNHRVHYTGGVLAESCGELLKTFFKERRS